MRLQEQTTAPNFSAITLEHELFDLTTPRTKPLLLAFFRYASCPLCNLRVHELIQNFDELKDQLDIVAVFQSPEDKIRQYVGTQAIPFPVLPDPQKKLYHLYGVESSWVGFAKAWTIKIRQVFQAVIRKHFLPGTIEGEIHRIPADFIIDTNNLIVQAYYGKDIGDHIPLNDIKQLIKSHETS
ncbi:MAG: AhpC/TSA family protein [Thiotrichales bacterium]|nr:AhpC/TSA family protein [Thiotrichales bacterium]